MRLNLAVDVQAETIFTVMLQVVVVELLHPDQPAASDWALGVEVRVHVPAGTVLVQGKAEQVNFWPLSLGTISTVPLPVPDLATVKTT